MDLPLDYTRPFFSYGLFQPGQIGFHSLVPHVSRYEQGWSVRGQLLQRDGLPVLLDGNEEQCPGSVIHFLPGQEAHAYLVIARIEPDKLYKWAEKEAHQLQDGNSATVAVNVLEGVKVNRGTHPLEEALWDGKNEPLFSSALEVVQETMEQSKTFDWDLKSLFRLQMAYMLLWTSIERYASFRYHLGDRVMDKLKGLSQNPDFGKALRDVVTESRVIYRSDDPDKKETLDANNPRKALDYYFQVRSNITHRGKAAFRDHETLVKSIEELLNIFRRVLDAEFRID